MKYIKKFLSFIIFQLFLCTIFFAETELLIGTGEFPPYTSENRDHSFLTTVLEEVGKEMGVKFKFEFMPWARCVREAEDLELWGVIPYVKNPEREEKFYFSDSLYYAVTKFFYYSRDGKKKNIKYRKLTDLKRYTIGGILGYYYVDDLTKAGLNLELVVDEKQNVSKAMKGRIDLFLMNETAGWYIIKQNYPPSQANNFIMLEKSFGESKAAYLMTSKNYPDNKQLLSRFNKALETVKKNGTYQKIINKADVTVTF